MKITVSEALRLKNEIAQVVNHYNSTIRYATLGYTTENNEKTFENDDKKYSVVLKNLIKTFEYSEEINNVIARFNSDNKVDSKVRALNNAKVLTEIYKNALPKTKPTKSTRFETVGNGRQKIEIAYVPEITSSEIKASIKTEKQKIRTLQSEIEVLNQKEVSLSFEFEDVENLIAE